MEKEERRYKILRELYDADPPGPDVEELPEHEGMFRTLKDLTYNAGYGYFFGLASGAAFGLYEGLIQKEAIKSWKLARTSILNHAGRRMYAWGNVGGTIGTMFTFYEAFFRAWMLANKDSTPPWVTHPWAFDSRNTAVASGVCTGLMYKSTCGKPLVILSAAVVGGTVAFVNSRRYTPEIYFDLNKRFLPDPMTMMGAGSGDSNNP